MHSVPGRPDAATDREPLTDRVDVLTVDDVKGLEFDSVVVVDPVAIVAESARGINDLYVALTRPTQRLTVLHHGRVPKGLDALLHDAAPPDGVSPVDGAAPDGDLDAARDTGGTLF
jgi:hypothetical protein